MVEIWVLWVVEDKQEHPELKNRLPSMKQRNQSSKRHLRCTIGGVVVVVGGAADCCCWLSWMSARFLCRGFLVEDCVGLVEPFGVGGNG